MQDPQATPWFHLNSTDKTMMVKSSRYSTRIILISFTSCKNARIHRPNPFRKARNQTNAAPCLLVDQFLKVHSYIYLQNMILSSFWCLYSKDKLKSQRLSRPFPRFWNKDSRTMMAHASMAKMDLRHPIKSKWLTMKTIILILLHPKVPSAKVHCSNSSMKATGCREAWPRFAMFKTWAQEQAIPIRPRSFTLSTKTNTWTSSAISSSTCTKHWARDMSQWRTIPKQRRERFSKPNKLRSPKVQACRKNSLRALSNSKISARSTKT